MVARMLFALQVLSLGLALLGCDNQISGNIEGSGSDEVIPSCQLNSSWQTTDEWQLSAGKASYPLRLFEDSNGHLYASGLAKDDSNAWNMIVEKSEDQGLSWSKVAIETGTGFPLGLYDNLIYRQRNDGNIAYVETSPLSFGVAWTQVTSLQVVGYTWFNSMLKDGNNLYFGGCHAETGYKGHVHQSTDGGSTFNTTDNFQNAAGKQHFYNNLVKLSDGRLIMCGYGQNASDVFQTVLRISDDNGSTWTSQIPYEHVTGKDTVCYGLSANSKDELILALAAMDSAGKNHSVLRRSTDKGNTWVTVDDYQLASSGDTYPKIPYFYSDNIVFSMSNAHADDGFSRASIRISKDSGMTWSDFTVPYQHTAGRSSYSQPVIKTKDGHLVHAANGFDAGGKEIWILRRMTCE
ncbi:MAG: exo-alpha-sialidase [Bdellovibrionales bacterium]|nr:exo-alpha-sialidase [Bdellovibrionales bacterium]